MKKFLIEVKEWLKPVIFVLVINTFVITQAYVPTGSMIPTINIKDRLIVNRIPTYYRTPKRGEIIVFRHDGDRLIKRCIAIAGDEIDLLDGYVYINGEKIDESKYLPSLGLTFPFSNGVQFPYIVPDECYFVMGDNRQDSLDSRYFESINEKNILTIGGIKILPIWDIEILD